MIYFISFLIGFLFNDPRIINRTFDNYKDIISCRILYRELGLNILIIGILINFLKGFFVTINTGGINQTLVILILFLGNYLGSKPCSTNGNELIIIWGIWAGINISIIQIPLALLISLWFVTKKFSYGFYVGFIFACINLLNMSFSLALLSFLLLANHTIRFYSLFEVFKNKIAGSYS